MRLSSVCSLCALLIAMALGISEVQAFKVQRYNFVQFSTQAELIVVAESVKRDGEQFDIVVKEYIQGTGPKQFKAKFHPGDWHTELAPAPIVGTRLIFLKKQEENLELFGAGTQAIWPQDENGETYLLAKDVKTVTALAQQVRGSLALSSEQRQATILKMVSSPDLFVKLIGFQLCNYLYSLDRKKYKDEVEIGAAHALRSLTESDRLVFYEALELAMLAPKSAALSKFLATMKQAPERAKQNGAFIRFTQVSRTQGKFNFQADTATPNEQVRNEGYNAAKAWLDKNLPRLITTDSGQILEALNSQNLTRRTAGRIWLQIAAGKDFGYKESDNAQLRATAVKEVEAWLQQMEVEMKKIEAEQGIT